ncbi:hypothetical protein CANCADRAFT_3934 [Tortispora caseinolytica NRRL Y-17796]|uniref:Uncharacterized protein n=1 Tax=Tortispora caseinolytica NRRL Y-17796 TaxID=767744 RepID=A0A1E4TC45_9ASCO|nr:hypothetical protein CANCADRAFT_3934 [Tortispora caseinolytica NRRL Y-17796]
MAEIIRSEENGAENGADVALNSESVDIQEREKAINEEYKIWKKNSPFMYDIVISSALKWPTLTVEWFPDRENVPGSKLSQQRLLLGTYTSGNSSEYVNIASVNLPDLDKSANSLKYNEDKKEYGDFSNEDVKLKIIQRIDHETEANKARYMPQNPDIIAAWTTTGDVLIYDRKKHSITPSGTCEPEIRLKHHKAEGFGLSWSPLKEGGLLTGSNDSTVAYWDITSYEKKSEAMLPVRVFESHTAIVNDARWHPFHESVFGSVSDDLHLQIHDIRSSKTAYKPVFNVVAHDQAVNTLAFNPKHERILATGSADNTVALWDMRKLTAPLHVLQGHSGDITSIAWSPHHESVLASGSSDRRIIIWDISRIGEEQTPEDAEDGPPELLFMHGGHTNQIADFSWNPFIPWTIASVAEDNLIQIWKISDSIVGVDNVDISSDEVE